MKTIRFNFKRILSLVSCFALFLSLCIPVNAAETVNGTLCSDLLSGSVIKYGYTRTGIDIDYTGPLSVSIARVYFKWDIPAIGSPIDHINITVYSSSPLDPVPLLYINDDQSTGISGTLVGTDSYYHEFQFYVGVDITSITFLFRYPTSAKKNLSIVNCLGFSIPYKSVQGFNTYCYRTAIDANASPQVDRSLVLSETGCQTPFSFGKVYGVNDFYDIYIDIPSSIRTFDHYDKVSFLIDYVGIQYEVGVSLYAPGGSLPNVILPSSSIQVTSFSYASDSIAPNEWEYQSQLITVDLSNVDLNDVYTLTLNLSFEAMSSGIGDQGVIHFKCRSIWFDYLISEQAWYVRMWSWISGGFDRVVNKLEDLLGNNSQKAEDLQDGADQIEDAAGAAASDQEVLNSVTRPSVDAGSLVGDYTSFDTTSLNVLGVLTGDKYISSLIILAITFALIGYVFFGKK